VIIRSRTIEEPKGTLPPPGEWVVLTESELKAFLDQLADDGIIVELKDD
jgi:hypothetical protein